MQEIILAAPTQALPSPTFNNSIITINYHHNQLCTAASSMQSYLQRLLRGGARHDDHNDVHQRGGCHPLPRLHAGDSDEDGGDGDDMNYLNMNSQKNCDLADVTRMIYETLEYEFANKYLLMLANTKIVILQTCTDSADSEPFSSRGRLGLGRRRGIHQYIHQLFL